MFNKQRVSLAIFAALSCTPGIASEPQAEGYVYSFGIDRISGLAEGDLGEYGCRAFISEKKFLDMLKGVQTVGQKYDSMDVRAKFSLDDGRVYFVDRQGFVREGKSYFSVDTKWLEQALSVIPSNSCP